jgi:DNA-binding transcriptional LysR family regulator
MLTIPNFERLKIFHIVYLNRSILKAANVLNVTRSAVSQSLKALEGELGTSLFIRDSKKFQPTAEAEHLFQTINPFVNELHSALRHLESGINTPVGHLRIGAPMDFGSGHLTKIIGKFRKKYPQVTFELHLAVPIKQLDLLCEGKLDLAFIDNGDVHAEKYSVSIQTVMKEEFVLVSSEKLFKEFKLQNLSLQSVAEVPIADYLPHAPVMRMWLKHHFSKVPANLNVIFSAESVRAVLIAIVEELGVGIVPRHLLVGEFKHLKLIETSKKPFINQIMIARQQGRRSSFRETEFIQFYRHATGLSNGRSN